MKQKNKKSLKETLRAILFLPLVIIGGVIGVIAFIIWPPLHFTGAVISDVYWWGYGKLYLTKEEREGPSLTTEEIRDISQRLREKLSEEFASNETRT